MTFKHCESQNSLETFAIQAQLQQKLQKSLCVTFRSELSLEKYTNISNSFQVNSCQEVKEFDLSSFILLNETFEFSSPKVVLYEQKSLNAIGKTCVFFSCLDFLCLPSVSIAVQHICILSFIFWGTLTVKNVLKQM